MDDELLSLIKGNKIFASLDDAAINQLLPKFSRIELNHNEVLFYQGDPAEAIYLLATGKLAALLTSADHLEKMVGHIVPGEIVGEAGALTQEARSLTIKALADSVLYQLPSDDFIALCHAHPEVVFATIHPVIARSRNVIRILSSEKSNKHIVILPAHKGVSLEIFYMKLLALTEKYPNLMIISDRQPELCHPDLDADQLRQKIAEFDRGKKPHKILYMLNTNDSLFAKICLKKADAVYIVADYNMTPKIDRTMLDRLERMKSRRKIEPALVLLYPENSSMPRNTRAWLTLASFSIHHHVRMTANKDFQRLLRFMRDRAVGLVLGGGGTRGWAHLGVIKALHESKIPIDLIGGTSVGAMIGAAYAIHESYEDAYERFYKIVFDAENSVTWRSFTWPAISFFSAKTFTEAQQAVFNTIFIEDLRIPFFCISCNLATNSEVVHRSGLLWERIRASASIPGIIPPMIIDNEIHLDGGLLNNLPVDVARDILGSRSRIISVEINAFSSDKHKYYFPPILTFWQTLLAKIGLRHRDYRFPRFVDTFLRALFLGSFTRAKQNTLAANLAINLNLGKFRLLHSNRKQAERLIEIGYLTALEEIGKTKAKDE